MRAYDLDWLFDNVENLRTIQGVMILGFSKAPYEIDDIIDRLDKYIRRTRARLAQRSIVINDKPRVFWPKHIRFDVPNATDPSLVEVDPVENLEGFFNDIHELAKQTSKPSS